MRKSVGFTAAVFMAGAAMASSYTPAMAAAKGRQPAPQAQQVCLPETETTSPRRSQLKAASADEKEFVRTDLDKDGDPDVLERWWNGHRCRWIDENDDMTAMDVQGDQTDDCLQIDRDGDGYYDGPGDMNVDWCDDDNDGDADVQVVAMNPLTTATSIHAGESHHMVFVDVDDDNVHGYVDWQKFAFPCWRALNTTNYRMPKLETCFSPDYNGNAVFLKVHLPPFAVSDPRYNWENPFAFYDFDKDGCTEMAIRFCDSPIKNPGGEETGWHYDGLLEDTYVTWDLDNDTQRGNEMDFDMTLRFDGGERPDYSGFVEKHPKLKAPDWAMPYFRYNNWRSIDELIYVPHDKCYDEIFKARRGQCWLVFDEDDDDHRWERVELYYPNAADPYSTARWNREHTTAGLCGHPQSDTLGDRGEYDMDNNGRGRMYIGRWDGKIHLYGAEYGAWTVDYTSRFWGSGPVIGDSSPDKAPAVEEVVLYKDTDNNGFLDEITYDYDGDKRPDLVVSLLKYKDVSTTGADVAEVFDPGDLKWQGMHDRFLALTEKNWQDAMMVYRAAWKAGINTPELDDLAIAASTAEKYHKAYWIKEKVFRTLDKKLAAEGKSTEREKLQKAHFCGDVLAVCGIIGSTGWQ